MGKDIYSTPLQELIDDINRMLEGHPKAVQLVYSFLVGFIGGINEK